VRNAVVEKATSYALAQGITAALFARDRGAGGQHVRVSMLDAGLAFFWPDGMLRHSLVGDDVENLAVPGERYQLMGTADGQIVLWASTGAQIHASLRAVGRDDLADSPRHRGRESLEMQNQVERAERRCAMVSPRSRTAEAYRRLLAHEVAAAPVLTHQECWSTRRSPTTAASLEASHPVYGRYRRARRGTLLGTTPPESRPAARYGDHTDEILAELGLSLERRTELRSRAVVA
jgi:crotonobetainyl-CoA:carnitine CoA-transferase CaiB-like acyl-CoA transferase